MIHLLVKEHHKSKEPSVIHFISMAQMNGFYNGKVEGQVISSKEQLEALKKEHKADDMIKMLLDRIDEDSLNGVVCSIIDGKCVTTNDKPGKNSVNKPEKAAA